MIQYITSRTNSKIKELLELKDPKTRKEKGQFLVEGFHLLEMALEANQVDLIITEKPLNLSSNIDQIVVSSEILKKFSSVMNPQGVIAVCHMEKRKVLYQDRILYLDHIQDPGNLGTLIRTAASFGFQDVILSNNSCSPYNEKVINASQGAIFKVNLHEEENTVLGRLKEEGYQILVTYLHGAYSIEQVSIHQKVVIVLGNEARGVEESTLSYATTKVYIPMVNMESLNVGVAGGILCYLASRKVNK